MKFGTVLLLFLTQPYLASSFFLPSPQNQKYAGRRLISESACYSQTDDDSEISPEERSKFEEIAQRFLNNDATIGDDGTDFPSAFPINPFRSTMNSGGGKDGLYSDEDLFNVLTLHEELAKEMDDGENTDTERLLVVNEDSPLGGIHDMVTKMTLGRKEEAPFGFPSSASPAIDIGPELKKKSSQIRAIASDVDGTILTSKMTVHPRTRLAIINAIKSASKGGDIQYFFPATGKSRKGALDSLGFEIGGLIAEKCGGVYLQGLFCVDPKGNVVFEKKLDMMAIAAAEALVEESGISIVGYDGDDLYTTDQTDIVIHLHEYYGEPLPCLLPYEDSEGVRKLAAHVPSMHKLILMHDDAEMLTNVVRPKLEALAEKYNACVTQALPTMLELLPKGCSKALGVQKLCEVLKIEPETELLAIGDAENDAGMLEMACIGVAVANASPQARDASDYIVELTNEKGGAGMAMDLFALNREN